ncbi:hypothetical protein CTA1_566 [Colletotrichum tanaceti]|uniref:Uncharacterized protein n=1 Tax=Colletotrichum tanaceti TaxID=1306861 RepID=A0A4U6X568_9PEZI|nr:hypothetical protein CTA1_566 [Colletotrichum tanaceti]
MSEHDGSPDETWKCPLPSLVDAYGSRYARNRALDEKLNEDPRRDSLPAVSIARSMSQHGIGRPFQDRDKARLFMHYVHDLSMWVDICDAKRHFGTEVPKRACRSPLLAYSIIALASRSLCCIRGADDSEPSTYYSHALQILIPMLDSSLEAQNEEVLAAIVILRQYEEMNGKCRLWRRANGSAFPTVWMTHPAYGESCETTDDVSLEQAALVLESRRLMTDINVSPVVGYQHYSLARMILHIFNPYLSKPGLGTFKRRKDSEEAVLDNFRLLLGLAISNPTVVNAGLTAAHVLRACGLYLTDPKERRESLELLDKNHKIHERTGLRTKDLRDQLEDQWSKDTKNSAFSFLFADR